MGVPEWVRDRSPWIAVPVCAPIVIFWNALTGQQGVAPADGYRYYLPLRIIAARMWRTGHIPVWNPFEYSGSPLLASAQTAVLYPPNALLLLSPSVRAFNVVTVLHFVIAGVGAFLLARKMTGDAVAASVAGASFGLSGFLFAHVGHHAIVTSAAWLPWCFLGYELVAERITPARALLGAGAVALTLLAGHPQTWFVMLAALTMYAVFRAALDHSRRALRLLAAAAVVIGLGVGLAAVQLLSTASIVDETARSVVDYKTAVSFSLTPSDLPLLVFPMEYGGYVQDVFDNGYRGPWNFTELAGYPTAAALVLAVAGLTAVKRDKRVLALAGIGLFAVAVALGGSTPLGRLVYDVSPYGQFRAWGRYLVFFDLAVAVLAAYGVAQLRAAPGGRRTAIKASFIGAGFVGLTALAVPHLPSAHKYLAAGHHLVVALLWPTTAAAGVAAVALFAVRHPRVVAGGLVSIVVADALFLGWHTEWRGSPSVGATETMMARAARPSYGTIDDAAGGLDRYIYLGNDPNTIPEFVSTTDPKDMHSASGYDPLAPKRYLAAAAGMTTYGGAVDGAGAWNPNSHVLDLLRISLVITTARDPQPDPAHSLLGLATRVPHTSLLRYDYRPRLAEASVVGQVTRVPEADVVRTVRGDVPFDPTVQAFVDADCAPCGALGQPGAAGTASVTTRRASGLGLDVQASRAGMLVVSQGWFPGWHATVDGRRADVHRVDGMLTGVIVGPGRHDVELTYRAPGLRVGGLITLMTLIGFAVWALVLSQLDRAWRHAKHAKASG